MYLHVSIVLTPPTVTITAYLDSIPLSAFSFLATKLPLLNRAPRYAIGGRLSCRRLCSRRTITLAPEETKAFSESAALALALFSANLYNIGDARRRPLNVFSPHPSPRLSYSTLGRLTNHFNYIYPTRRITNMFAKFTAIAALLALAAPITRGAVHNVTVGGPGILKYDPEFVVSTTFPDLEVTTSLTELRAECGSRRPDHLHLPAEEPHGDAVFAQRALRASSGRLRLRVVSAVQQLRRIDI